MINGIWKNIYPEKFYTFSIPMPASESEVILLNQLIKLEKKKINALEIQHHL